MSTPDAAPRPDSGPLRSLAGRARRNPWPYAASAYAALFALWLAGARWVVPRLIRDAYAGESLGVLNDMISGQSRVPVEAYLDQWSGIAGVVTTLLLAAGLVLLWFLVLDLALRSAYRRDPESGPAPEDGHALGLAGLLASAVCLGSLTGYAEAGYLAERYLSREWIPAKLAVSEDYVWMIPLAYMTTFVLLAAAIFLLGRLRRRLRRPEVAATGFVFLGVLSLLQATSERLELYAAALLAAGLAVQTGRMAARRPLAADRIARRAAPWLLGVWLLLAAAVPAAEWWNARRAEARLPAAEAGAPNVLLIVLDTVRGKNLSLYGYERPTTPALERLAERGTVFELALATSPWTLPTHGSLFTGRPAHDLSTDWKRPLDDTHPTLAEVLGAEGFESAAFVGNLYYGGEAFGLGRGFARYDDQPRSAAMVVHSAWLTRTLAERVRRWTGTRQDLVRKTADDINRSFLSWLDRRGGRPFFVFLNYYDGHDPYLPPAPFDTRFSEEPPLYWLETDDASELTSEQIAELVDAYDNSIAYLDDRLGRLFAALEERGILENTLVVVTSDHGEEFGEHGLLFHGHTLYLPALHVPLILSLPGRVPAGLRVSTPVSLADVPATIADFVGGSAPPAFPGVSLVEGLGRPADSAAAPGPVLAEVTVNPRTPGWYPVHKGDMQTLVWDGLGYIRNGDGTEELYDLASDPEQRVDLSSSETGASRLPGFRERLREMLGVDSLAVGRR